MKPDRPTIHDFDGGPAQVWTAMPNGSLTHLNAYVATVTGLPVEAIASWGWSEVIHPDDLPDVAERWSAALESGDPYIARFRLRGPDGAWRWQIARAEARFEDGVLVGWVGITMDVHDVWKG